MDECKPLEDGQRGARRAARRRRGRAVQVDPIKATLKAPGTKRLKLKCDEPLLSFAFKYNLRRYAEASHAALGGHRAIDLW